tara:strand:- start:69 stop:341 length:273 start_codon:yes stop_codon:yes gene_type:complete
MSETESEQKEKLKKILSSGYWSVIQYQPIDNSNDLEAKLLFENIPGILIWDFFSPNTINEIIQSKKNINSFKLISTGLDDVVWTYIIDKQ